jgi:hypothetical protein
MEESRVLILSIQKIQFRARRGAREILHQNNQITAIGRELWVRRLLSLKRFAKDHDVVAPVITKLMKVKLMMESRFSGGRAARAARVVQAAVVR